MTRNEVYSPKKVTRERKFWSSEIKIRVLLETLESGAVTSRVARKNNLPSNLVYSWVRMWRQGILVLPVDNSAKVVPDKPVHFCNVSIYKGDVKICLDSRTPATRIAEIVNAL